MAGAGQGGKGHQSPTDHLEGENDLEGASPDNSGFGISGFGIYVHWPFCAAKCPYCDFNSHVRHQPVDQMRFARASETELDHYARRQKAAGKDQPVTSVFFGGGTPSLMQPQTVAYILDAIHRLWTVTPDAEITLEANPTSVEAAHFSGYRAAGVNRVSLGVQSLYDDQLRFLARLHDAAQARKAIELAQQTFPRMSFDLIYARPHQTPRGWAKELNEAIDLAADHLSLYQLTIEEQTPFHALYRSGKFDLPDEDQSVALYETTQEICSARGLPAYEISNHARKGSQSRHNLTYWRYGDYVGVGAGAHGRLTLANGRIATANERHPESWLKRVEEVGTGALEEEVLSLEAQGDESLIMGLRITEGVSLDRFEQLAGRPLNEHKIATLIEEGLLARPAHRRICTTSKGALLLNALVAELASG